jgi:YARHG domain
MYAHMMRNRRNEKNANATSKKMATILLLLAFNNVIYTKEKCMTRLLLFFATICIAICGCNNAKKDSKTNIAVVTDTTESPVAKALNILGSYVGAFGTNKITLLITKATTDSVTGRSIVGGNDRPFAGTIIKEGARYVVNAKEPGDDKEDGIFNLMIDEGKPNELRGSWKPNKETTTVKEKAFNLERKQFTYKQDVGDYPQASTRLLKISDVENLMKEDLEFMRNEIFARHGYCFQKKALRQQFEMQDWYVPNTINIKNNLTELEKKNIALIKKYEKYAEEYGDDFGR